jgi:hypothetical protein
MPLTQNAPFECGCCGLGATLVTRPSATVTSEPQHTEHSQQVLGKMPSVVLFDALDSMLFIARDQLRRHPEERAEGARLEGWKYAPCLLPSFETAARKRAASSG